MFSGIALRIGARVAIMNKNPTAIAIFLWVIIFVALRVFSVFGSYYMFN